MDSDLWEGPGSRILGFKENITSLCREEEHSAGIGNENQVGDCR